eukprot:g5415.t2
MDRFASMHDEDIDKLGIPSQGAAGGEGGWRGRKRARELSQLKDRLDRAADKEQQSWDLLKQAVEKGGGAAADEGRFKATGTNRAAEEMRERTVGLVTADEFRKAREAADSLEEAEAKRRQEEEAAAEEAREAARRKAERKKKKAADKKKRLEKSKMSFALEEDEEEQAGSGKRAEPSPLDSSGHEQDEKDEQTSSPGAGGSGGGACAAGAEDSSKAKGDGGGVRESRSLKGAAPDEENSSVASMLRARLGS